MKVLTMVQGTPEWLEARRGIPTASQFHRLLTPKTMKPSAQAKGYIAQLCVEWALGVNQDEDVSQFMQRGHELESRAFAFYELEMEATVDRVGFILRDDGLVGCSPDGLVSAAGGMELKCPGARKHVEYLLDQTPTQYLCQVQGGIWIAEREWWDFESFHPMLPPVLLRFPRDEGFIKALKDATEEFLTDFRAAKEKLTTLGVTPSDAPAMLEQAPGDLTAALADVLA